MRFEASTSLRGDHRHCATHRRPPLQRCSLSGLQGNCQADYVLRSRLSLFIPGQMSPGDSIAMGIWCALSRRAAEVRAGRDEARGEIIQIHRLLQVVEVN